MELLAVMAIIVIIMVAGIPAYNSWMNRSGIARAKATIAKIELALEKYKADNGAYPDHFGELNNPVTPDNWRVTTCLANYMTFDKKYLGSGNPPEPDVDGNILLDPWGKYYVVIADNDGDPDNSWSNMFVNKSTTFIYSYGPNKDVIDIGVTAVQYFANPVNKDNIDNFTSI